MLNLLQHRVLGSEFRPAMGEGEEVLAWGVRGTLGISSPLERMMTWFVGLGILGAVLVVLADLFTRVLDWPAVWLSKWLEGVAFAGDERGKGGDGMEK